MYNNYGLENEVLIRDSFNNKTYLDLNENLKKIAELLFPEIRPNDGFTCALTDNYIKPDIVLSCRGRDCFISIKTSNSKFMHTENINSFIEFLRGLDVSEETLETILLFQFGDGTIDGTGEKRMNYTEVYVWLGDRIKKANFELNERHYLIEKVVERVMFQGVDRIADSAEYIYVGNVDYGNIVSKRQVKALLRRNDWHFYDNLHIGPIMIRPHARYAGRTIVSDDRRKHIMCSWANFESDVLYMKRKLNF